MKDWIKEYWIFLIIILLVLVSIVSNKDESIKANIIMKDQGLPIMRYDNVEIFQDDSLRLAFIWNDNIVVIIKNSNNMKINIEEIDNESSPINN